MKEHRVTTGYRTSTTDYNIYIKDMKNTSVALLLAVVLCGGTARGNKATFASFRKDYYLSDKVYPELFTPNPTHGGRIHIVSSIDSTITFSAPYTVKIGDVSANTDPEKGSSSFGDNFDWLHVDINNNTKQVAISFHTHSDSLVSSLKHIMVTDSSGKTILDAPVELPDYEKTHPLVATYVTTTDNFSSYVIHLHNYGSAAQNITGMIMDGERTALDSLNIGPGEHTVLKTAAPPGAKLAYVWTLGVTLQSGRRIGYGGRIVREFFPIGDWPKHDDCPFPLSNLSNYNLLRRTLSVDTHFAGKRQCNIELVDTLHDAAKKANTKEAYYILPSHESTENPKHVPKEVSAGIIALGTGDEADNSIKNAPPTWQISRLRRTRYPWAVEYLGGHSHKFIGTFAGIADIQSTDFYVAACAPHITAAIAQTPLRGAYDYIRNMRNNHMPLTSWGYSQAFEIWTTGIGIQQTLNPGEVTAQIASVIAAGGKGVQLFQSKVSLSQTDSNAWAAAGELLSNIKAVRDLIRVGDVEGAIFFKDDKNESLVSVIASEPGKLLVVAINANAGGYNDLTCYLGIDAHWKFKPHTINNLAITLPGSGKAPTSVSVEEAVGGKLSPAKGVKQNLSGKQLTLSDIALGTENVARIFVLSY